MKEYTVKIYTESYNSYVVKADNSESAIMKALIDFFNENEIESMITIKTTNIKWSS